MSNRIVAIGASAGGVEALGRIAEGLPPDLPAPVCVVMHTGAESPGILASILAWAGALPAVEARDGMRLIGGRIVVAPPHRHLVLEAGRVRVTRGPKENRARPAIDPLFRSAAQVYGPGAIGVLLTGDLDDGTAGIWTIKRLGGVALVQDPSEARSSRPCRQARSATSTWIAWRGSTRYRRCCTSCWRRRSPAPRPGSRR